MPTVPSRSVGLAPLPGVRVSPEAPAAAFPGAQPSRVDLGGVQQIAQSLYEQQVNRANQLRVNDAVAQAGQVKSDLIGRLLQAKGTNAIGMQDQIQNEWKQRIGDIGNSLNPIQRQMFDAHATSEGLDLGTTVQRHIASESEKVADQSFNARQSQTLDDAVRNAEAGNAEGVTNAIASRVQAVKDYGHAIGMSQEAIDYNAKQAASDAHTAVVGRLLDGRQDQAARAYFDATKDAITQDQQGKIERALKAGSILGDATRQADAIIKTPNITQTDALAQAEAITDPQVRQEAIQQVEQHYNRLNTAQRLQREGARTNVIKALDASHGVLNRASPDWQIIEGHPEGSQVLEYQRQLLHPPRDPGDPEKMAGYVGLYATSPATREMLASTDIATVLHDDTLNSGQKMTILNYIRSARKEVQASGVSDLTHQLAESNKAITDINTALKNRVTKQGDPISDADAADLRDQLTQRTNEQKVLTARLNAARKGDLNYDPRPSAPYDPRFDAAPSDGSAPVVPSAPKPNAFGLSAGYQPTEAMLMDVGRKGDGYANYLRTLGYAIPSVLPKKYLPVPQKP